MFVCPPGAPARWLLHAGGWLGHRPWLLAVAAVLLIAYLAGRNMLAGWRCRHHSTGARVVAIAPPPQVDPHATDAWWANLAGTLTPSRWCRPARAPHVVRQYTWTGRQLTISVRVPGTVPPGAIEAAVRAEWPGAACPTSAAGLPRAGDAQVVGGYLLPIAARWLPLRTDFDTDPLRALMAAGSLPRPGEHACVQVLTRPAIPPRPPRPAGRHPPVRRQDPGARPGPGRPDPVAAQPPRQHPQTPRARHRRHHPARPRIATECPFLQVAARPRSRYRCPS